MDNIYLMKKNEPPVDKNKQPHLSLAADDARAGRGLDHLDGERPAGFSVEDVRQLLGHLLHLLERQQNHRAAAKPAAG